MTALRETDTELQLCCAHLQGTDLIFIFKWENGAKRKEMLMIMSLLNHCDIYMVLRGVQRSPHFLGTALLWGTISFCGELLLMENDLFWGPL